MDSFFKDCLSPEWQEFINHHKQKVEVDKNDYIFKEGDVTEGIYIVEKGKVKVVSKGTDDKNTLVRLAADGGILGHRGFGGSWIFK